MINLTSMGHITVGYTSLELSTGRVTANKCMDNIDIGRVNFFHNSRIRIYSATTPQFQDNIFAERVN